MVFSHQPSRWLAGIWVGLLIVYSCFGLKDHADGSEAATPARKPWITSHVVGSPDPPPPFKVVRVFPNLKFEHPLLLTRAPGSDRLFVGEQAGVLYSFP